MIRHELRKNEDGEPEVWTNLGDLLDWLEMLPSQTQSPIAAGTALEIKRMLLEGFDNAPLMAEA